MPVRTCDHLKQDGVFCSSPALKGRKYCFFHLNLRGRLLKAARARRRGQNPGLFLPFPEDMHAVQIGLGEILWALADDRIDTKRAGLMLYTLQQAATNLTRTPGWEGEREAVESSRGLRALDAPDFEHRFGLPPGLDLETAMDPDGSYGEDTDVDAHSSAPECSSQSLSSGNGGASNNSDAAPLSPGGGDRVGSQRVPLPEEQARRLKMTQKEALAYFIYRVANDIDSDDFEAMAAWLRTYRRNRHSAPAAKTGDSPRPPAVAASGENTSTPEAA